MIRRALLAASLFLSLSTPSSAQNYGNFYTVQDSAFVSLWERFGKMNDAAVAGMNIAAKTTGGDLLFQCWTTISMEARSFSERSFNSALFLMIRNRMNNDADKFLVYDVVKIYASNQSADISKSKEAIHGMSMVCNHATFALRSKDILNLIDEYDNLLRQMARYQ